MAKKKRDTRSKVSPAARAQILADIKSGKTTARRAAKQHGVSVWTVYGWRKMSARKRSAKKAAPRGTAPAERARILAEMDSLGLTAKQAAKKYGVSVWTIYDWRKAKGGGRGRRAAKRGRPAAKRAASTGMTATDLSASIRAALPSILRQEIARALSAMIGGGR
jgi:transposase-like protein